MPQTFKPLQIPDDVSLMLLGAPSTYADREYVVEAHADFCQPRNDYRIHWAVAPLADQRYTRIPGRVLRLPPGTLQPGQTYTVDTQLQRENDSEVIILVSTQTNASASRRFGCDDLKCRLSQQSIKVQVLRRGFEVGLIPDRATIGVGSPLVLRLLFVDGDYGGVAPLLLWTCATATGEVCEGFQASGGFEQTVEFASQGEYVHIYGNTECLPRATSYVRIILYSPSVQICSASRHHRGHRR